MFNIPFTGNVKLKGIIIMGEDDDSHPSEMRLCRNIPQMSFDDRYREREEERAGSVEREKERFQKYLEAQPLHSLPAGVCLASQGEACCCRVNSPWLPALTSQCANESRTSGDARACYLAFVEWSRVGWRCCQSDKESGLALGPRSAG